MLRRAPAKAEEPAASAPQPAEQKEEATPTPHQFETAARELVADVAKTVDEPEVPEGTPLVSTTVREALRDAMAEEMRSDPRVFVMGEEVAQYQGAYKVTQGLLDEFGPKRVIDTPITEYGFAGLGSGAAMGGLKPIVEFMTFNFAMQAIDHIINSAAKTNYMSGGQMRCPIVFRGPNGAAARVGAQHSQNYGPWYASVPGLIVIAPYSASDAKGLLKAAIRSEDPVVFLENELLYGQHFDVPQMDDYVLPIGKARIVRPGKDVTIVSYSIGVGVALEAAQELMGQGINAEVIDLRTLRPLDKATVLESLKRTNRLVVVEEGWPTCSILQRDHGNLHGRGLRRPRCASDARDGHRCAAALCGEPREAGADQGVGRGRGRKGRLLSLNGRSTSTGRPRFSNCRREVRPAFAALWGLDLAMADVVATSSQPALGAIRLAWWRERLEALDEGIAAPAEPRLKAVQGELLRRTVTGEELSKLEDAWLPLFDEFPWGRSAGGRTSFERPHPVRHWCSPVERRPR